MAQKYKKHEKTKSGVKIDPKRGFPSYREAKEFMDAVNKRLRKK